VLAKVDRNDGVNNFLTSGRKDNVGAVIEGLVEVPQTGIWTFGTISDDGSKLWIGGQEVVDNDGLHGDREIKGEIHLEAGLHPIRVEVFERGGAANIQVKYGGPGFDYNIIPKSAWMHEVYEGYD